MLMTDSNGRTFRWDDRLTEALREVERQLAERESRRPKRDGLLLIDTRAHPDLAAAKERAFDEAAERYRNRPEALARTLTSTSEAALVRGSRRLAAAHATALEFGRVRR